jgi:class 3 adenylate cyclase
VAGREASRRATLRLLAPGPYDRRVTELPSGTVTFVFTDIEGSTELLKRLGEGYADVLTRHRRIVRGVFASGDGVEMDTQGDAFFFVFRRAKDAAGAAVEVQRAHASEPWPVGEEVRVRIGLHTGEPALHEEGYVGLDVVRAARICTLGRGGQILLSETTRALLGSGLPDGVSVFPVGQKHLRGIDEPERVYEMAIDDLEHDEREPVPAVPDSAAPAVPQEDELARDIARRFEGLGARLASGIQQQVLRSLEKRGVPGGEGASADEIAARVAALGAEIDARVEAALAQKGVVRDEDS